MSVSEDVIRDLLPIYQSGEASPGTKMLVEEYLRSHPSIAELARQEHLVVERLEALPGPSPTVEARSLNATRRLLRRRSTYLLIAMLFTIWPLSFSFGSHVVFFFQGLPVISVMLWGTAAF